MWRSSAALVISIAALLTDLGDANAASSADWLVRKLTGTVTYTTLGTEGVPVTEGDFLSPGMSIGTGSNGRVRLERGIEWLVVLPDSRVTFLETPEPGMDTTIKIETGKIGVHVRKQSDKHFSIEAPQAVAAVKGTTFSVTAKDEESEVAVIEGLVEVTARGTKERRDVRAGERASVRDADGPMSIGGRQGDSRSGSESSPVSSAIAIFKIASVPKTLEDLDPPSVKAKKAKGKSKKDKGKSKGKSKKGSGGYHPDDHEDDRREGSNRGPG